jgi:hypothetical protein
MTSPDKAAALSVHLAEYEQLKAEQVKRIGFRDQMINVHLALVGASMGWALTHNEPIVFLLVPWICVILGWTYLVNDDRISAIARYLRKTLRHQLREESEGATNTMIVWEDEHRQDSHRIERKTIQFCVDVITFICSGFVGLAVFVFKSNGTPCGTWLLVTCEALLLISLLVLFYRYLDSKVGD